VVPERELCTQVRLAISGLQPEELPFYLGLRLKKSRVHVPALFSDLTWVLLTWVPKKIRNFLRGINKVYTGSILAACTWYWLLLRSSVTSNQRHQALGVHARRTYSSSWRYHPIESYHERRDTKSIYARRQRRWQQINAMPSTLSITSTYSRRASTYWYEHILRSMYECIIPAVARTHPSVRGRCIHRRSRFRSIELGQILRCVGDINSRRGRHTS